MKTEEQPLLSTTVSYINVGVEGKAAVKKKAKGEGDPVPVLRVCSCF